MLRSLLPSAIAIPIIVPLEWTRIGQMLDPVFGQKADARMLNSRSKDGVGGTSSALPVPRSISRDRVARTCHDDAQRQAKVPRWHASLPSIMTFCPGAAPDRIRIGDPEASGQCDCRSGLPRALWRAVPARPMHPWRRRPNHRSVPRVRTVCSACPSSPIDPRCAGWLGNRRAVCQPAAQVVHPQSLPSPSWDRTR